MPTDVGGDGNEGNWFGRIVPQRLALAGLRTTIRTPDTIRLGEPTSFYVVVKNRLPVPVTVSTSTSRLWGWEVDGIQEADRRSFSPPEASRDLRIDGLGRRVFEATWDGRIHERRNGRAVWVDALGTHTLTGYLAVENWNERGLAATAEVTVVDPDGHQK